MCLLVFSKLLIEGKAQNQQQYRHMHDASYHIENVYFIGFCCGLIVSL